MILLGCIQVSSVDVVFPNREHGVSERSARILGYRGLGVVDWLSGQCPIDNVCHHFSNNVLLVVYIGLRSLVIYIKPQEWLHIPFGQREKAALSGHQVPVINKSWFWLFRNFLLHLCSWMFLRFQGWGLLGCLSSEVAERSYWFGCQLRFPGFSVCSFALWVFFSNFFSDQMSSFMEKPLFIPSTYHS